MPRPYAAAVSKNFLLHFGQPGEAELDRQIQAGGRGIVIGTGEPAGAARDAPHAVANLTDLPAQPA